MSKKRKKKLKRRPVFRYDKYKDRVTGAKIEILFWFTDGIIAFRSKHGVQGEMNRKYLKKNYKAVTP